MAGLLGKRNSAWKGGSSLGGANDLDRNHIVKTLSAMLRSLHLVLLAMEITAHLPPHSYPTLLITALQTATADHLQVTISHSLQH